MAYGPRSSCTAIALALRCAAIGCALGAPFGGASAAIAAPAVRADVHPYAASVAEASQRFGIPERWIWRVMHAESRGNARAVSHACVHTSAITSNVSGGWACYLANWGGAAASVVWPSWVWSFSAAWVHRRAGAAHTWSLGLFTAPPP